MIGADELHRYTCTIQRARIVASGSPYHPGQTELDFGTPAATTTVACRIQRLDSNSIRHLEMVGNGKSGTLVASDYLFIAYGDAPASLVAQGSTPSPESLHRVVDVKRPDSATLDAGPFDIVRVVDMAGAQDVLKLELKRVQ